MSHYDQKLSELYIRERNTITVIVVIVLALFVWEGSWEDGQALLALPTNVIIKVAVLSICLTYSF